MCKYVCKGYFLASEYNILPLHEGTWTQNECRLKRNGMKHYWFLKDIIGKMEVNR